MIRKSAIAFALLILPGAALAQDEGGLGLDLTAPEEAKPEESPKEETDALSTPAPRPSRAAEEDRKPLTSKESLLEGERDVTVDDRVKSVQRKLYLKKGRFELSPFALYQVNDPYYARFGAELRGAYYLADTLAIGARGIWFNVLPTDDVRVAKRTFQSRIFYSVPQWGALGAAEWSPIYGKFAIWNNILHFDSYVAGGAGVVLTETSSLPDRGPNPAAMLGLGARFVAKDFLAVTTELTNVAFVDAPTGTSKGSTQNLLMLKVGVSMFVPFKSTTREAE